MDVNEMELNQREEAKLDSIASGMSKAIYWVVISTCLAFSLMFVLMFFGDYVGVVYNDQDIVQWCEEYHPNWTYEQCESMTSR
jgi:hypothetical protein